MDEIYDYKYFKAAFDHFVGPPYTGDQKRLSIDTGLSATMISKIAKGEKNAGIKSQIKIANALEFNLEDFLKYGQQLIEKGHPPVKPATYPEAPEHVLPKNDTGTVHLFPTNNCRDHPRLKICIENLRAIFESGHDDLIGAIDANLTAFKASIDDRARMKSMETTQLSQAKEIESLKMAVNSRPP